LNFTSASFIAVPASTVQLLTFVVELTNDFGLEEYKGVGAASQVAYLASGLFLDYKDDLIILVVNTLTQDLKSDNYLTGEVPFSSISSTETVPICSSKI
jgi:hypothetical protein